MSQGITPNQLTPIVPISSETVTLTDAQIKALPTTIPDVVPAQAGKILRFLSAHLLWDSRAGAYTNLDNDLYMVFRYSAGDTVSEAAFVGGLLETSDKTSSDVTAKAAGNESLLAGTENRALQLHVNNAASGNFTGGNAANTLKVTVLYTIIDLEAE